MKVQPASTENPLVLQIADMPRGENKTVLEPPLCRSPKHEGVVGQLLISHLFDIWPTSKAAKTFARMFPPL